MFLEVFEHKDQDAVSVQLFDIPRKSAQSYNTPCMLAPMVSANVIVR